jgi:6-phosphofructokinase
VLACQFGNKAVELLATGEYKRMVGIRGEEVISVDLDYSWREEKKIDLRRYRLAEILSL